MYDQATDRVKWWNCECVHREGDYQQTAKTSVKHQSTLTGPTNWVLPTCWHAPMMAEQSACECHYGNDMTLERKQSGSAQTNKKKKMKHREAKCTKKEKAT